jgi:hypothetical protein
MADIEIEKCLKNPSSQWKDLLNKSMSASIDPTTTIYRASPE